jgi:hypothetical protein
VQNRTSGFWRAWNWKSALLSAVFRAPVFILTGYRFGWRSILGAVAAESIFRIVVSGFYGAIAQKLTNVKPRWKAVLILVVVLPAVEQSADFLLHRARGTPNLGWAMLTSCIVMALSAMFNWYAMTRGALRTDSGKSFLADLRSLPRILVQFVGLVPLAIWRGWHEGYTRAK